MYTVYAAAAAGVCVFVCEEKLTFQSEIMLLSSSK